MYCPNCHTEYIEKIDTCADCHIPLVLRLPEEEELLEKKWVELHEFSSKTHAEMAGEILKKAGLNYYIKSNWLSSALQITGPSTPGNNAVIFMPEEEIKEAAALIAALVK